MDQTIEAKILPLVEALNAIDGVCTIASCQGHFPRISDPYVFFSCSPRQAEAFAKRLDKIQLQGNLHHWWRLTGEFDGESRLCFVLRSPSLDREKGALRTFLNYVVFRKKIDNDLSLLSDMLQDIVDDGRQMSAVVHPHKGRAADDEKNGTEHTGIPPLAGNLPERVVSFTMGTGAFDIGGNISFTNKTGHQRSHGTFLPGVKTVAKVARLFVVVILLAVTLGACANVELQKDGSGSDEMLKSPCACAPVPYDPTFFTWDVG
jgi:hypothetical protein